MQNITKASTESESSNGLVILPYIKGKTEQLKRVLCKHKFKVAMKPMFTLRSQLMRPKDALGELKQSGVVYSIPCEDCDVEYIGETGRAFGTRQDEHERAVQLKTSGNSALAKHVHDEDEGFYVKIMDGSSENGKKLVSLNKPRMVMQIETMA